MKSTYAKNTQFEASRVHSGFTIIELLIVIVIIGVLVAIAAVPHTGITRSANEAAAKSDLKQARTALELNKAKTGTYPASLVTNIPPINQPQNTTFVYTQLSGGQGFSLVATSNSSPDTTFYTGPNSGISQVVPFRSGDPIQTANIANCPTTRTMAVDARDNSTYWIQKLADNQCWMLTNLAYGGGTPNGGANTYNDVINHGTGIPGSNTINNGTSDGSDSATYTLAKYYIPPGANRTITPTPPSTSTDGGTTNPQYGYLYNWCAAMGGQDTGACSGYNTPTPVATTSICPAGWRLPTSSPGGEFPLLNDTINGGDRLSGAGLLVEPGMFQLSGYWGGGFKSQGVGGLYWSSTKNSESVAYFMSFRLNMVNPAGNGKQSDGFSVRCIAG